MWKKFLAWCGDEEPDGEAADKYLEWLEHTRDWLEYELIEKKANDRHKNG